MSSNNLRTALLSSRNSPRGQPAARASIGSSLQDLPFVARVKIMAPKSSTDMREYVTILPKFPLTSSSTTASRLLSYCDQATIPGKKHRHHRLNKKARSTWEKPKGHYVYHTNLKCCSLLHPCIPIITLARKPLPRHATDTVKRLAPSTSTNSPRQG